MACLQGMEKLWLSRDDTADRVPLSLLSAAQLARPDYPKVVALQLDNVARMLSGVLRALLLLTSKLQIVHRDLKNDNVMLKVDRPKYKEAVESLPNLGCTNTNATHVCLARKAAGECAPVRSAGAGTLADADCRMTCGHCHRHVFDSSTVYAKVFDWGQSADPFEKQKGKAVGLWNKDSVRPPETNFGGVYMVKGLTAVGGTAYQVWPLWSLDTYMAGVLALQLVNGEIIPHKATADVAEALANDGVGSGGGSPLVQLEERVLWLCENWLDPGVIPASWWYSAGDRVRQMACTTAHTLLAAPPPAHDVNAAGAKISQAAANWIGGLCAGWGLDLDTRDDLGEIEGRRAKCEGIRDDLLEMPAGNNERLRAERLYTRHSDKSLNNSTLCAAICGTDDCGLWGCSTAEKECTKQCSAFQAPTKRADLIKGMAAKGSTDYLVHVRTKQGRRPKVCQLICHAGEASNDVREGCRAACTTALQTPIEADDQADEEEAFLKDAAEELKQLCDGWDGDEDGKQRCESLVPLLTDISDSKAGQDAVDKYVDGSGESGKLKRRAVCAYACDLGTGFVNLFTGSADKCIRECEAWQPREAMRFQAAPPPKLARRTVTKMRAVCEKWDDTIHAGWKASVVKFFTFGAASESERKAYCKRKLAELQKPEMWFRGGAGRLNFRALLEESGSDVIGGTRRCVALFCSTVCADSDDKGDLGLIDWQVDACEEKCRVACGVPPNDEATVVPLPSLSCGYARTTLPRSRAAAAQSGLGLAGLPSEAGSAPLAENPLGGGGMAIDLKAVRHANAQRSDDPLLPFLKEGCLLPDPVAALAEPVLQSRLAALNDLLRRLAEFDYMLRPSPFEALQHPFFWSVRGANPSLTQLSPDYPTHPPASSGSQVHGRLLHHL